MAVVVVMMLGGDFLANPIKKTKITNLYGD
jgi:hypothetical protein